MRYCLAASWPVRDRFRKEEEVVVYQSFGVWLLYQTIGRSSSQHPRRLERFAVRKCLVAGERGGTQDHPRRNPDSPAWPRGKDVQSNARGDLFRVYCVSYAL